MRRHHPQNERVKRRYLQYLKDAKGRSVDTVDQAAASIAEFEAASKYADFRKFHIEWARRFKRVLGDHVNPATGKPLAKATIKSRLMAVKAFVQWLADKPGYKSRIDYADAEYFNLSGNDDRIARATRERPAPTLDQIRHVLDAMPADTDIQRRDRALIAFTILSGARDNAIASLSLKHVDVARRKVSQDAREVRTKRAKTMTTDFFPVGEDIEAIVADWISYLGDQLGFGPDDPLFPATEVKPSARRQFEAIGLSRRHWSNAGAIRRIFRAAFETAGLQYFNPHSFRNTLALLALARNLPTEALKAWSQNLGHEDLMTTLTSYGKVSPARQAEILSGLRNLENGIGENNAPDDDAIERAFETIRRATSGRSERPFG